MAVPTQKLIRGVWAAFQRVRVLEDPKIVQGVAGLLARREALPSSLEKLVPPVGPDGISEQPEVKALFKEFSEGSRKSAELFDKQVLFQLKKMQPGSRYPTPRHIVAFMYKVAEVEPQMSLMDPACGSGGFLVHHLRQPAYSGATSGIEVDSEWAGLAATNLTLHHASLGMGTNLPAPALRCEDSIAASTVEKYDRVLMNPPFEEPVHSRMIHRMLQLLGDNGKACTIVPAGMLFGTGSETTRAKRLLLGEAESSTSEGTIPSKPSDRFHLRAIVQLPEDACRPFAATKAHVLLIHRGVGTRTWFLRAETDGYKATAGRNLMVPQATPNDLTFIESTLLSRVRPVAPGPSQALSWDDIVDGNGVVQGFLVRTVTDGRRFSQIIRREQEQQLHLEVQLTTVSDDPNAPEGGAVTQLLIIRDGRLDLVEGQGPTGKGAVATTLLSASQPDAVAFAVDAKGRLLGVEVPTEALRQDDLDLSVERYLLERTDTVAEDPASIVSALYSREERLLNIIGDIRELLEDSRVKPDPFPPQESADSLRARRPFGGLAAGQAAIWQSIIEFLVKNTEEKMPLYFNAADILGQQRDLDHRLLGSTLLMFEKMGLILFVQLTVGNEVVRAFRLSSAYDSWSIPVSVEQEAAEKGA